MKNIKTKKTVIFLLIAITCIFLILYAANNAAFATSGADPDVPQDTPETGTDPDDQEEPTTPPDEGSVGSETQPGSGSQTQQPSSGGENTTGSGSSNASSPQGSSGTSSGQSSVSASSGSTSTSGQSGSSSVRTQQTTDTRLRTLTISCGQLIPEFDPDIYQYTVYVSRDAEDKSCGTMAEAISQNVDITAEGPLEYGDESVEKRVIVSADDGSRSEYVIDVHVVEEYELLMGNTLYSPMSQIDISGFPEGFSVVDTDFSDVSFPCAVSSDGILRLICLSTEDEEGVDPVWYTLNSDNSLGYTAELMTVDGQSMIIISFDGQLAHDDNGFLIVTGDGQDFLPLYAQEDGDEDTVGTNSRVLTIVFACIAAVLAVACVFLIRNKKSSNRQPAQDSPRYFMPYLKLDEEDEKETTRHHNTQ